MKIFASIFKTLDKNQVIRHIEQEVQWSMQYFVMLLLSVVIATLGLIINNNAIIIGAMLISPLIWPIIGISLATVRSKKNLMKQSFGLLVISLCLIILVAYAISLVSPFKEVSLEMQSRVNPTVFDLLIALAAGLAATLILTWPKFADALAGVAIAASLLPPICVTGIGLAFRNSEMAYGSFVLFMTNLASIIFAGIVVFSLAHFYQRDDDEYVKRLSIGLVLSIVVIGIIGFQLAVSLRQIIYEDSTKRIAHEIMSRELTAISNSIVVERINIGSMVDNHVNISADVKAPVQALITVTKKNEIIEDLSQRLNRNVSLNLNITQVLKAATFDAKDEEKKQIEQKIDLLISDYAHNISSLIEVQSVNKQINLENNEYVISTVWQVPDSHQVSISQKNALQKQLEKLIDGEVQLEISILEYYRLGESQDDIDGIESTKQILLDQAKDYAVSQQSKYRFEYVDVVYDEDTFDYTIILGLLLERGDAVDNSFVLGLRNHLARVFSPVDVLEIEIQTRYYTTEKY